MMSVKFKKLFEPIKIGKVIVKNRIYMPSMCMNYAGPNGEVTERDIAYYEARARGGAGLITVDYACISPEGRGMPGQRGIWKNEFIPGLSRLVDVIKSHGATASIQLHHAGVNSITDDIVGPSRLGNQYFFVTSPRELSTEEVEQLVEKYADAALRAKAAGFDMVEVHGTHGYLIAQFLSPIYNKRTDKYGRDRALFALEIIKRIKEKCGEDYPVIFRLIADELVEGGITLEYSKKVAKRLQDAGVDALNVTAGSYDCIDLVVPNMYLEDEEEEVYYRFIKLASEIKKVVNIPVCSGGLISDPEIAEKVLEEGMVDMVFIGRQLIADPDWPRKVMNGELKDIRPCLACMEGCIGRIFGNKTAWCTVNPLSGFEYEWGRVAQNPPKERKKVLIIGAGPAGMEAARIAATRGHEVLIVEKSDEIGGTIRIASIPTFKKRFEKLISWYDNQLKKLGVKIQLNTEAKPELIEKQASDVVIIATGSEPIIPDIPGIEKTITADDVLKGKKEAGKDIIIMGGGLVGCETALHLAKDGKNVTIVEALSEVARDMEITSRFSLTKPGGLLEKYKVKVVTKSPVAEVKDGGVVIIDELGRRKFIKSDTTICAVGRRPVLNKGLVEKAKEVAKEVYIIGDAKIPRKVIDAIHEAFSVAMKI